MVPKETLKIEDEKQNLILNQIYEALQKQNIEFVKQTLANESNLHEKILDKTLKEDQSEIFKLLIEHNIIGLNFRIKDNNLLLLAIGRRAINCTQALIMDYKVSIELNDNNQVLIPHILLRCVKKLSLNLLEYLYEKNSKLFTLSNSTKRNLLHVAIDATVINSDTLPNLEFLLKKLHKELIPQLNQSGFNPLHHCLSLNEQSTERESSINTITEILIKAGADINARTPKENNTPLMLAVAHNRQQLVKLLIKNKCNFDAVNARNQTALIIAASMNRPELAGLLVEAGANINAVQPEFWDNYDAFANACANGSIDVLRLFMDKKIAFNSLKSPEILTAIAVKFNRPQVLDFLHKEKMAVLNYIREEGKFNLLHLAAEQGCVNVFDALITRYKFKIDTKTPDRHLSSLHIATINGKLNIIEYIIRNNAMYYLDLTIEGYSALHLAVLNKQVGATKMLIRNGCDIDQKKDNKTAFDIAEDETCKEILKSAHQFLNLAKNIGGRGTTVENLLKNGASLFQQDDQGRTPLHLAALHNNITIIEEIIMQADFCKNYKALLSINDDMNRTPIDLAKDKTCYPKFMISFYIFQMQHCINIGNFKKEELAHDLDHYIEIFLSLPEIELVIESLLVFWEKIKSIPNVPLNNVDVILDKMHEFIKNIDSEYEELKPKLFFTVAEKLKNFPGYTMKSYQAFHAVTTHNSTSIKMRQSAHEHMADILFSGRVNYDHFKPKDMEIESNNASNTSSMNNASNGLENEMEDKSKIENKEKAENAETCSPTIERSLWHLLQAGNSTQVIIERSRRTQRFIGDKEMQISSIDPATPEGLIDLLKLFNHKKEQDAKLLQEKELNIQKKDIELQKMNKMLSEKCAEVSEIQKKLSYAEGQHQSQEKLLQIHQSLLMQFPAFQSKAEHLNNTNNNSNAEDFNFCTQGNSNYHSNIAMSDESNNACNHISNELTINTSNSLSANEHPSLKRTHLAMMAQQSQNVKNSTNETEGAEPPIKILKTNHI